MKFWNVTKMIIKLLLKAAGLWYAIWSAYIIVGDFLKWRCLWHKNWKDSAKMIIFGAQNGWKGFYKKLKKLAEE